MMRNEQLGGIHRYSTMLAENLMGPSTSCPSGQPSIQENTCYSKQTGEKTVDGGSMELLAGKCHVVLF